MLLHISKLIILIGLITWLTFDTIFGNYVIHVWNKRDDPGLSLSLSLSLYIYIYI